MTLKEIAIELLEKYESAETSVIWECSGNISSSEDILKKEINKYRKMIDEADRKTEPFDKDINVRSEDEPQTTSTPYKVDTSSICKIEPQTERRE